MTLADVLLLHFCPLAGCALACCLYAAPVNDLRAALRRGSLDKLNPLPFAFAFANCYGWIVYGYFRENLILAASTLPGFLITLYLNMGAIKLQYHARHQKRWERACKWRALDTMSTATYSTSSEESCELLSSNNKDKSVQEENLVNDFDSFVPQELVLYNLALMWMIVCVYADFFTDQKTASFLIGWVVNLIMLVFYGAPLELLRHVIESQDSAVIHRPTMAMSFSNAFFWVIYGLASNDPIVYGPNAVGCVLTIAQMILCCLFPTGTAQAQEQEPLLVQSISYTVPAEVPVMVV